MFFYAQIANSKQANAIECDMETKADNWMEGLMDAGDGMLGAGGAGSSGGNNSQHTKVTNGDAPATDELMARLQDSYDQTTRLMLSLKKAAQELVKCVSITQSGRDMVKRGQDLSKTLQSPIDEIDELLVMPRTMVTSAMAMKKLQAMIKPYMDLECFYAELMALHTLHVPKARAKAKASAERSE